MKTKLHNMTCRFLSVLLVLCTLVTLTQGYFTLSAAATSEGTTEKFDYVNQGYETAEEKWASMASDYTVIQGIYEMRIDPVSAEVAVRNVMTGEINFTNPYNLGNNTGVNISMRERMMSQVILECKSKSTGSKITMYSYNYAVKKGQFTLKKLQNGFSVSYTLGTVKKRTIVPRQIKASRFEEMIMNKIADPEDLKDLMVWYLYYDVNSPTMTKEEVALYQTQFKITKEIDPDTGKFYAIYALDEAASAKDIAKLEAIIKSWSPEYTFEEVEADHEETKYEAEESKSPLFKLTMEYYLDEQGMYVSLPSNSIRFDETAYTLSYISVLPYYGAGDTHFSGYGFVPDGSGALLYFEDAPATLGGGKEQASYGNVYGQDFALHSSTVRKNETVRLPVFGLVENFQGNVGTPIDQTTDDKGNVVNVYETVERDRGFFAVIEEGEAFAAIITQNTKNAYQYAYASFYPRPSDEYDLSQANSAAKEGSIYNIVADRKYTGNCVVRFFILNDADLMAARNYKGYEASYVGMAKLYREYLEELGVFERLTVDDVKTTIPLYIESFGAMDVKDTVLSIPVTVKVPLTTFDDLTAMYDELEKAGISNVNFRLTGFVNGGMDSTVPGKIKIEKKLGGKKGYEQFVAYARDKGFGVFLEFDFTQVKKTSNFDGFSAKRDALKTIDNRYTRAKMYDPVYQTYGYTRNILISVEAYDRLYSKFVKSMSKFDDHIGISVGTLGSTLNSDYDEDDSYNRDDAQQLTEEMLARLDSIYGNLMIDAGNSYALPYASHILKVSLDSSNFQDASRSIPFMGMVFHGYVNFTGKATNTASDLNFETMKIIENGAAPYYILSYQNTNKLKEDFTLSQYYAVSYEYSKDAMISKYHELNALMADLQTSCIDNHEFLTGMRVVNDADKEYDAAIGLTPEEIEAKYTVDNGKIVKVTYENGTSFYLNYNNFDVTVNGITLPAISYIKGE